MKHPLTKFLIFLVLATYPPNIFPTSAEPTPTVTDKLINAICAKTRNPSDCQMNLRNLKGKGLSPNPVAVLGSGYMDQALSRSTALMTWYNYQYHKKAKTEQPSLKSRYYTCFERYREVVSHLRMAKKFMQSGDAESVGSLISVARNKIDVCDKELMKPPKFVEVEVFVDANGKVKDMCWVVSAICENVGKLR